MFAQDFHVVIGRVQGLTTAKKHLLGTGKKGQYNLKYILTFFGLFGHVNLFGIFTEKRPFLLFFGTFDLFWLFLLFVW